MSIPTFNPQTLPKNDNINSYAFCWDLSGQFFVQRGKMIAYYGQMRFETLGVSNLADVVARSFSAPLFTSDFMIAAGQGQLIIGDLGHDINAFDLEDGNLTVRASNLLGFDPNGISLKQSIIPGFVTLLGTGKFLASSNGPVHFVEPPIRVDPEALVGWADCPSPCHHYGAEYMTSFLAAAGHAFGVRSGEEHQFDFTGSGTVLMQSTEKARSTDAIVRQMESQVGLLGQNGLLRMQRVIAARLQQ